MTYEILTPLQHKEKIIFGLTFEQLIYAAIALVLDAFIFKLIPNTSIKFTLIILITVTAILFMFFKAKDWIKKNLYHFYKLRKTDINSELMKEYIWIQNITDDLIINNKNQKIATYFGFSKNDFVTFLGCYYFKILY